MSSPRRVTSNALFRYFERDRFGGAFALIHFGALSGSTRRAPAELDGGGGAARLSMTPTGGHPTLPNVTGTLKPVEDSLLACTVGAGTAHR